MQSVQSRTHTAAVFWILLSGCGTQIGNPTGSGIVRPSENVGTLSTLVNAAFLQTVDGMNMGDYAYARSESRVSTDRNCQTQSDTGISLVEKADSRHSVIDESTAYYVKSDLTIKRSYQDAWTQNGVLLACDPITRSVRFDYQRLQFGTVRLESQVDEDLSRSLYLAKKVDKQELRHNLVFKKTGKRTLNFVNYTESGREVILNAQLNNQVESTIALSMATDGIEAATLRLRERLPLNFTIALDQSKEWARYVIPKGRQEFSIPTSDEVLRLEFSELTFSRDGACIPISGQLVATVLRPNASDRRYSITFKDNAPLIMQREDGTDSLVLAPFACVLKER